MEIVLQLVINGNHILRKNLDLNIILEDVVAQE